MSEDGQQQLPCKAQHEAGASLVSEVTDREILVGVFNAICGLAEKLTGQKMVVFISTSGGDLPYQGVPVAWLPSHRPEAAAGLENLHQFEHSPTQPEPLREHRGIQQEHR
jgi:hypothetical protein